MEWEGTKTFGGNQIRCLWQLHILLIDGIRGSAYGPFEVDRRHGIPSSGLMVFFFLVSLWVRYIVWVLSFVLLWCLPALVE